VVDNNTSIYVVDQSPQNESRYRARFWFDPNSITMANGNTHYIFYGLTSASASVVRVEFRFSSGNYQLRVAVRDNGNTWTNGGWTTISDAPHVVELDWRASSGSGANSGGVTLWIDGTQVSALNGTNNDTRQIDQAWMGAVAGIDNGTRGTYYFDAFESHRQSYIGLNAVNTCQGVLAGNCVSDPSSSKLVRVFVPMVLKDGLVESQPAPPEITVEDDGTQ
jgi:hypothetical protein